MLGLRIAREDTNEWVVKRVGVDKGGAMKKNLLQQLEAAGFKKCHVCSFVMKEPDHYCRRCGSQNQGNKQQEKEIVHLFDPRDYNQYSTLPLGYEARTTASLKKAICPQEA